MGTNASGAKALQRKFEALEHPAIVNGDVLSVPHWGLRVHVTHSNASAQRKGHSACFRQTSYLDRLAHPVVDVNIGSGETEAEAVDMAAESYMSSVFPVIHSICCTEHCAYGVENRPLFGSDSETGLARDWRLIRGPQWLINAPLDAFPSDAFETALQDEFARLACEPGTYWFKCFAGRCGDEFLTDCFLNNVEQPHGKRKFLELAKSFRADGPLFSCKQHLLVYPADPDALDEYRKRRASRWRDVLKDACGSLPESDVEAVIAGFETFHDFSGMDEPIIREELQERGCSAETALKLVSFLPAACVRDYWENRGIVFGSDYILLNYNTGRSITQSLTDDPIFQAASRVIKSWKKANVDENLLNDVKDFSAENNAIRHALAEGAEPDDIRMKFLIVPTEEDIDGEYNEELLKLLGIRSHKPWWKFW